MWCRLQVRSGGGIIPFSQTVIAWKLKKGALQVGFGLGLVFLPFATEILDLIIRYLILQDEESLSFSSSSSSSNRLSKKIKSMDCSGSKKLLLLLK